jgi:hypothetical protein
MITCPKCLIADCYDIQPCSSWDKAICIICGYYITWLTKAKEMEKIICQNCGSVDDFHTVHSGPHIKAICNGCDKYIKFISTKTLPDVKPELKIMAEEKVLPEGIRFFDPNANAPEFVLGTVVISLNEFFNFCKTHKELTTLYKDQAQIKLQILRSQAGKMYSVVDTFKPATVAAPAAAAGRQPATWGRQPPAAQPATQQFAAQTAPDDLPF